MTEKQAWWTIAKAYETPRGKRTIRQINITLYGICNAIFCMEISERIDESMDNKVWECVSEGLVFCDYEPENDKLRADFCYLMYYMLEYPNEV